MSAPPLERPPARAAAPPVRSAAAHDSEPTLVIQPSKPWRGVKVRELWRSRELFRFFVWREIKVRYAQSVLGAGWALLQPMLAMAVFSLIFGRFARLPSDGVPYPVFTLAALVPWTYFSTAVTAAGNSLVGNPELLTKVYFTRLALPFAPVLAGLLDFSIAFLLLLAMMLAYGLLPGAAALLVPLTVLPVVLTAAGVGCWLSALNVQYRDVKHATPFLIQLWLYGSPIVYPMSLVPEEYRTIYALNPMAGAIEGLRAALLGTPWPEPAVLGVSGGVALLLFVSGLVYFRRTERIFADVA